MSGKSDLRRDVVQLEGGEVSLQVKRLFDLFAVLGADLAVLFREVRGGA